MRNIPGLLGLVLMLLALAETKSEQQQSFNSDNGLRIEFNNTEKLQEVNIDFSYSHYSQGVRNVLFLGEANKDFPF